MHNLCFYFECPISHKEYDEANSSEGLENLGPCASVRWKYIAEIHVLFPGEVGHIYVARRADLPHYQEVLSKFVAALEAYDGDKLSIFLYLRGEDYQNHFLTVYNKTETVQPFIERMDWMEVQHISCRPKKKATKSRIEKNVKILTRIPDFVLPSTKHELVQQMASRSLVSNREQRRIR